MRWKIVNSLCEICIYEAYIKEEMICARYPAYNKNCKRDNCGEFKWDAAARWGFLSEINTYIRNLNYLKEDLEREITKRRKYEKLAKQRWHEIKALKQRVKELEKEE